MKIYMVVRTGLAYDALQANDGPIGNYFDKIMVVARTGMEAKKLTIECNDPDMWPMCPDDLVATQVGIATTGIYDQPRAICYSHA